MAVVDFHWPTRVNTRLGYIARFDHKPFTPVVVAMRVSKGGAGCCQIVVVLFGLGWEQALGFTCASMECYLWDRMRSWSNPRRSVYDNVCSCVPPGTRE